MAALSIVDTPDGILETLLDQLFAESAKHDLQQHLGGWYVSKVLPKATVSACLPPTVPSVPYQWCTCTWTRASLMLCQWKRDSSDWCADAHMPIVAPIMVELWIRPHGPAFITKAIPAFTGLTKSVSGMEEPGRMDENWAIRTNHTWTSRHTHKLNCCYTCSSLHFDLQKSV